MKRRNFLALAGGGVVVAAGARLGAIATRHPETALAPWEAAGGEAYSDPRLYALSYAILAPNPHNMQPWLVDLSAPDHVILRVDRTRLLPHTDPFNRQITIGLGCFLEVMAMAAAEKGFGVEIAAFPEGFDTAALDDRPVAVCRFTAGAGRPDPLFAHVLDRRSLKEPYDRDRPVPETALAQIQAAVAHGSQTGVSAEAGFVAEMRALTLEALRIEFQTPRTYKESVDVFRIGAREIEVNPDGIDFQGPLFEVMGSVGLFSREAALNQSSTAYAEGIKAVELNATTAMGFVWQVTPGNTRPDQIMAGRDWVRINLASTAAGIGMQPMSQALQEYPEMATLYAQAHQHLAPEGGTVQMLARLGYGKAVGPSPRWPIEAKLV